MKTLEDVLRLSGIPKQTYMNWIAVGHLKPSRPGSIGRGNTHRFSDEQVAALREIEATRRKLKELLRRLKQIP